jgi:hypothetical protein
MKTMKFAWGSIIFFVGAGVAIGGAKIALDGLDTMIVAFKELV